MEFQIIHILNYIQETHFVKDAVKYAVRILANATALVKDFLKAFVTAFVVVQLILEVNKIIIKIYVIAAFWNVFVIKFLAHTACVASAKLDAAGIEVCAVNAFVA